MEESSGVTNEERVRAFESAGEQEIDTMDTDSDNEMMIDFQCIRAFEGDNDKSGRRWI
jgi:hypothetical protein